MNKQIFNTAAAVVVAAVFCIGCGNGGGGGNTPASLTGQWVDVNPRPDDCEELELLSDGTAVLKKEGVDMVVSGAWKIVDKRFLITVSAGGANIIHAYNYKLSGHELTLVDDKGYTSICVRKEKLEEDKAKRVVEEAKQATRAIEQLGQNFVFVPVQGGTFKMGCTPEQGDDCDEDENPAHSVTVSNFSISRYEVTQGLWKAVMGEKPSKFEGDNLPVETVSWNNIQEFIQKLNEKTGKKYRLPTEAEWEYAARGGNKSKGYKYSGGNEIGNVGWYVINSGDKPLNEEEITRLISSEKYDELEKKIETNNNKTHPVGTKKPNELGIYDMTGNVLEWVSDRYGDYTSGAQTNPTGAASGSGRMNRGGSWIYDARDCRVSFRYGNLPDYRINYLGFRLVLSS